MAYIVTDCRTSKEVGVFNHVPRTGGTYLRSVLTRLGYHTVMKGYAHSTYPSQAGLPSFCFIRNPLTWYPSCFSYRMSNGWPASDSFIWHREFEATTLEGFVNNVKKLYPSGYLYSLYATFGQSDKVCKYEVFNESLCTVLALLDCKDVLMSEFASIPRNESLSKPTVTNSVANLIKTLESRVFVRWEYEC